MKKIISLFAVLMIILCLANNTIAAMQCKIVLSSLDDTEVKVDDEFKVDVQVSDIYSSVGLVTFGATLDYDKTSLKLEKMEGIGDYSTPAYNEKNGKILIERNPTNHNATMFTLTFKVLKTDNVTVNLKDITFSDGTGLGKVDNQSYTPKIKITQGGNNQGGNNPGGNNQGGNNQGGNNNQGGINQGQAGNQGSTTKPGETTTKGDKLPQTGLNDTIIPCAVIGLAGIAVMAFVKAKKITTMI